MARVRSVLAVSAVSLWFKAADYAKAKRLAYEFLGGDGITDHGRAELEELVEGASRESELRKYSDDPGMIPIDIKMEGGRVGIGVALASSARRRRDAALKLLGRCADLEARLPYRERGETELTDQIEIYEARAEAASFGLRFYVATAEQQPVPGTQRVTPEQVARRFLDVAKMATSDPDEIRASVDDAQYADSFIEGFGEIAPDGTYVRSVRCASPTWKLPNAPRPTFEPRHRDALRAARSASGRPRELKPGERGVDGTLLIVHLSLDSSWLEIDTGESEPTVIMVTEPQLQAKVAGMFTRGQHVRAIGKYSRKAQRLVLRDIVVLKAPPQSRSSRGT